MQAMDSPIELCTRLLESFDANTKLLVGAVVAIVLQLMIIAKQYLDKRKNGA